MPNTPPLATQVCEDRNFADWHRGCPWCAVWLLRVDVPLLCAAVEHARAAIAPWLLPRYARQPHVTLAYRGLMAGQQPHAHAEFGLQQLQRDVQALQSAYIPAFDVEIAGFGSFSTVPYIAVASSAALQRCHDVLMALAPYPDWHYVPHVTLGHYARQLPIPTVLHQLQQHAAGQQIAPVPVSALWLARYQTEDIAGRLFFEGRFDLHTQRYHAAPGALLAL